MPVTDDILAEVYDLFTSEAVDFFTVSRDTNAATADAFGQEVPTFGATTQAAIPCFYKPLKGAEQTIGSELKATSAYEFHAPAAVNTGTATNPVWTPVDIIEKDRLQMAARGNFPQRTFEVADTSVNQGITLTIIATLEGA